MKLRTKGLFVLGLSVGLGLGCGGEESGQGTLIVKGSGSATALSKIAATRLAANVGGSPTSFGLTFYAIYISANADCSNPIQVADFGEDGQAFDLLTEPTLVEEEVAEGTYQCVIGESSDVMTFTVDETAVSEHAGICETGTTYTYDIYRAGEVDSDLWVDLDGAKITATGTPVSPGANRVTTFNTTGDPSLVRANGVAPDSHQLGTLSTALVVPGQTTFYIDASDQVSDWPSDGVSHCWLEQPLSGFR